MTVPFVLPTIVVASAFEGLFARFGLDDGSVRLWRLATGEPNDMAGPFSLDRFRTGFLIDEAGAAAVAH